MTNISQVTNMPKRYARGDVTRARIIDAALEVFGTHGFEDTSTRLIARRAGVNLAALHYYFDSKQGLYLACAEHLAELGEARVAPFLALMHQPGASREALLELLHRLLDAFADRLVEPRDPPAVVAFFLREQISPSAAYELLHRRIMGPMLTACASLVGRLIGRPANAEETMLRTLALLGPLMVFQRARETSLRALGWPDYQGERLACIKALMWQQAEALIESPRPRSGRGPQAARASGQR